MQQIAIPSELLSCLLLTPVKVKIRIALPENVPYLAELNQTAYP